jgi:hypothetical protein
MDDGQLKNFLTENFNRRYRYDSDHCARSLLGRDPVGELFFCIRGDADYGGRFGARLIATNKMNQ